MPMPKKARQLHMKCVGEPFADTLNWSNRVSEKICKQPEGKFKPVVDFSRCEAKGPCAEVCPYDVFEIRKIEPIDYAAMGLLAKLKNRVHGGMVSYTPGADRCRACGLCVKACPEHAIALVKAVQ